MNPVWKISFGILSLCWILCSCGSQGESLNPEFVRPQLVGTLDLPGFNPENEKLEIGNGNIWILKKAEKDTEKFELKKITFMGVSIDSIPLDLGLTCSQKIEIGLFKEIFPDRFFIWVYCGENSYAFFVSSNGKVIEKIWSGKLERPYGAIFPSISGNGVIVSDFCKFQAIEKKEIIWQKDEKDYSFPNLSNGSLLIRNSSRLKLFNIPEKSSMEFSERSRHFGLSSEILVFDSQDQRKIFVYQVREKILKSFSISRDLEFPTGLLRSVVFPQRSSSKMILFNKNGVFEIDFGKELLDSEMKNGREKNEIVLISAKKLFLFKIQDSRVEF